jgi:hypothetical protein
MSQTSNTYKFIREINILETKAISGEVDKFFINKFPFKVIAKWGPIKKLMKKTRLHPFAKRTFENGMRREIYDVMQPIDISIKKMEVLKMIREHMNSLNKNGNHFQIGIQKVKQDELS